MKIGRSGKRAPLPQAPDFEILERASHNPGGRRLALLALMGDLNFAWSNNESLFIYVIMLLLDTDEAAAAIVFATLNTTRARLDLVDRLARIRLSDKALRRELDGIVKAFSASTRLRNEINHATFILSENGEITHTQAMKLEERSGELRFGARLPVDEARIVHISASVDELYRLNRRIWGFLPKLEAAIGLAETAGD
ncbi:hypothetical protein [Bosea psychrotolerans]|uniref:Uncharacterized protein n=1 Tax=Bosea psychrotolerans TaxID=1871628 RepID=A0A2S4LXM7_9HYPH|nr:hypothetical protein [Bosea psychrotolerans]POR47135.1 hypothetical protein CYD53_12025 [Bosea psychrotolerans]